MWWCAARFHVPVRYAGMARTPATPSTFRRAGRIGLGLATGRGKAWRRHLRPEPRLALGRFLRETVRATAAMDLSDGLSLDLARLSKASGLGAEISPPPVWRGATLAQALHGGEDYELLFTAPPRARVPAAFENIRSRALA